MGQDRTLPRRTVAEAIAARHDRLRRRAARGAAPEVDEDLLWDAVEATLPFEEYLQFIVWNIKIARVAVPLLGAVIGIIIALRSF